MWLTTLPYRIECVPVALFAHHAAERGAVTARRIRPYHPAVRRQVSVESVEHHAGLHSNPPLLGVDLQDGIEVPGTVDDQGRTDGLPGQRRPAPSRQHRHVIPGGRLQRRLHIVGMPGDEHAKGLDLADAGIRLHRAPAFITSRRRSPARRGRKAAAKSCNRSARRGRQVRGSKFEVQGATFKVRECSVKVTKSYNLEPHSLHSRTRPYTSIGSPASGRKISTSG